MPLALTFLIPTTRVFKDPAQYDIEINEARGFKSPIKIKSKKINHTIRVENGVIYDPDQYDVDENIKRHVRNN